MQELVAYEILNQFAADESPFTEVRDRSMEALDLVAKDLRRDYEALFSKIRRQYERLAGELESAIALANKYHCEPSGRAVHAGGKQAGGFIPPALLRIAT